MRAVDYSQESNLVPFQKDFYFEHPNVTAMTAEEVTAFHAKHDITTIGKDIPKPIRTFEEASFPGMCTVTVF